MALAHIRNGQLIARYGDDGKGWVTLESGSKMSPPVVGTYGNDKIVPIVEEYQDTSTGTVRTITEDTGWQIEADRVYRLVTKRDMTAQELADVAAAEQASAFNKLDNRIELKIIGSALWHIARGTVPAPALDSPANFKTWLRSLA